MRASTSSESASNDGSPRRDFAGEPVTPTMSPRCSSSSPVRSTGHRSWIRPLRSTRSRKTSFPMSRRAITRPASRRVASPVAPSSSVSASARTATISSRSGKRFGVAMVGESSPAAAGGLRRLDVHDLELERAARGRDLDGLALLAAHDRLAHRGLVRQLVLCRIRLGGADDVVLDGLVRLHVAEAHSAFSAMSPNSRASRMRSAISRRLSVERYSISSWSFLYPSGVRMTSFKTTVLLETPARNGRWADARQAGADGTSGPGWSSTAPGYDVRLMPANILDSWRIGEIEIPTRVVLAPMAGVSVQAFRRQGRRYGAGLVCSEMVSCAGIEHRNERTLGYLRVAADEHPLAIQLFGSEPHAMADAARMVEAVGADIVDLNFGCPVRKVTRTGAGATLLETRELAPRIVESVAEAVDVPVTVKLRRGLENGSRACLDLGPRLVEAGAASLTLHPRSAQQMYTGTADHSLTAELVSLVDVPVVASGDITSRARAQAVLATTGASAVMVGRGAQGNPWALRELVNADGEEPSREEVIAEL